MTKFTKNTDSDYKFARFFLAPAIPWKLVSPKWNPSTTDLIRRTNLQHKQLDETCINSININNRPCQFYRWTTPRHWRTLHQIRSRRSKPRSQPLWVSGLDGVGPYLARPVITRRSTVKSPSPPSALSIVTAVRYRPTYLRGAYGNSFRKSFTGERGVLWVTLHSSSIPAVPGLKNPHSSVGHLGFVPPQDFKG